MDGKQIAKIIDDVLAERGMTQKESLHLRHMKYPEKSTQTVEISGLFHVLNCSQLFKSDSKSVVKVLSKMGIIYNEFYALSMTSYQLRTAPVA